MKSGLSSRSRTRHFLIKVNADDAPERLGVPTEASDWEGGIFTTGPARKTTKNKGELPFEKTRPPRENDRLHIWINETPRTGGRGKGLTATAEVAVGVEPSSPDTELGIRVRKVRLLPPGIINNDRLRMLPGDVFTDIKRSSERPLRCIPLVWARDIDAACAQEIKAGRQAVMRLIERRANQGRFRKAIIYRDRCRCIVTGCEVDDTLEAAHLIPYAYNIHERDNPCNGILLRADIHLLFDRGLMAIEPRTMTLWVSPQLQRTDYYAFSDRRVDTGAGLRYLRDQYERASAGTQPSASAARLVISNVQILSAGQRRNPRSGGISPGLAGPAE
jgi:hypothetical protein